MYIMGCYWNQNLKTQNICCRMLQFVFFFLHFSSTQFGLVYITYGKIDAFAAPFQSKSESKQKMYIKKISTIHPGIHIFFHSFLRSIFFVISFLVVLRQQLTASSWKKKEEERKQNSALNIFACENMQELLTITACVFVFVCMWVYVISFKSKYFMPSKSISNTNNRIRHTHIYNIHV